MTLIRDYFNAKKYLSRLESRHMEIQTHRMLLIFKGSFIEDDDHFWQFRMAYNDPVEKLSKLIFKILFGGFVSGLIYCAYAILK